MEEKPRYGYEIVDELKEKSGGYWDPSYGTVYGGLERLQEKGYIKRVKTEHENRKYFRLTEKGKEQLEKEREKKQKNQEKIHKIALGFLHIHTHIYGKEKMKELKEKIEKELQNIVS